MMVASAAAAAVMAAAAAVTAAAAAVTAATAVVVAVTWRWQVGSEAGGAGKGQGAGACVGAAGASWRRRGIGRRDALVL